MDRLFVIQLVTSFIVGGSFIAFLSFIAERASEKIAGMIISLPATVAISFFFIGWALSPQKVAEIAPVVPIMTGGVMIFSVIYLYLSKIKLKKLASIVLCIFGSLLVWFLFAIPVAYLEVSNLTISLIAYVLLTAVAYYFLTISPKQEAVQPPRKYAVSQKIGRAIFAGSIITLAVFLSKALGPFWGGVFSSFPAVFLSTLIVVHWNYDSSFLFKIWKNAPLGSLVFIVFTIVAIYTFPALGIWGGTLLSYSASLLAFLVLTRIQKIRTV